MFVSNYESISSDDCPSFLLEQLSRLYAADDTGIAVDALTHLLNPLLWEGAIRAWSEPLLLTNGLSRWNADVKIWEKRLQKLPARLKGFSLPSSGPCPIPDFSLSLLFLLFYASRAAMQAVIIQQKYHAAESSPVPQLSLEETINPDYEKLVLYLCRVLFYGASLRAGPQRINDLFGFQTFVFAQKHYAALWRNPPAELLPLWEWDGTKYGGKERLNKTLSVFFRFTRDAQHEKGPFKNTKYLLEHTPIPIFGGAILGAQLAAKFLRCSGLQVAGDRPFWNGVAEQSLRVPFATGDPNAPDLSHLFYFEVELLSGGSGQIRAHEETTFLFCLDADFCDGLKRAYQGATRYVDTFYHGAMGWREKRNQFDIRWRIAGEVSTANTPSYPQTFHLSGRSATAAQMLAFVLLLIGKGSTLSIVRNEGADRSATRALLQRVMRTVVSADINEADYSLTTLNPFSNNDLQKAFHVKARRAFFRGVSVFVVSAQDAEGIKGIEDAAISVKNAKKTNLPRCNHGRGLAVTSMPELIRLFLEEDRLLDTLIATNIKASSKGKRQAVVSAALRHHFHRRLRADYHVLKQWGYKEDALYPEVVYAFERRRAWQMLYDQFEKRQTANALDPVLATFIELTQPFVDLAEQRDFSD